MLKNNNYILLLTIFLAICGTLNSQIIAPEANYSDATEYIIDLERDSLFFFNYDNDSLFILTDTSGKGNIKINWQIFDRSTGLFSTLPDTGTKLNVLSDTIGTGYRLIQEETDTFTCWVIKNREFDIDIVRKDENGNLERGAYYCNDKTSDKGIDIQVIIHSGMYYVSMETLDTIEYNMKYNYSWETVYETGLFNINRGSKNINFNDNNPYWDDQTYNLTVSDMASQEKTDEVFVESIFPKAGFKVEYIELDNADYYVDKDPSYYEIYGNDFYKSDTNISAPALFRFTTKGNSPDQNSENTHRYYWNFKDLSDSTTPTATTDTLHEYLYWGEYLVTLTAEYRDSVRGLVCLDIISLDESNKIVISRPKLNAPNAIAVPEGIFRFSDVSVINFEIVIYNRYGRRVHHFEGDIRDWDGWDGRNKNSNNYVPTGVYYYIVKDFSKSVPFRPPTPKKAVWFGSDSNNEYRGFFHVFNTE